MLMRPPCKTASHSCSACWTRFPGQMWTLFLGEGTRQEYGMIRFDGEPFDVSESYMRLMLEG